MKLRNPGGPGTSWAGRLLRGRRLDRNPLRRRSDRMQTVVLGALLAGFLAGAPFASQAAGGVAYAQSAREVQVQHARVHQVRATLLQAAPPAGVYYAPDTEVRWRAPDGQPRTGSVYILGPRAANSTTLVWINRAGRLASPPLRPSQIAGRVQLAESLAVTAVGVTLIITGLLACRALNRRRMAAWDADWLAHGPRWSPRP